MQALSCRTICSSKSACGTHLLTFPIFPIALRCLRTAESSIIKCLVSSRVISVTALSNSFCSSISFGLHFLAHYLILLGSVHNWAVGFCFWDNWSHVLVNLTIYNQLFFSLTLGYNNAWCWFCSATYSAFKGLNPHCDLLRYYIAHTYLFFAQLLCHFVIAPYYYYYFFNPAVFWFIACLELLSVWCLCWIDLDLLAGVYLYKQLTARASCFSFLFNFSMRFWSMLQGWHLSKALPFRITLLYICWSTCSDDMLMDLYKQR